PADRSPPRPALFLSDTDSGATRPTHEPLLLAMWLVRGEERRAERLAQARSAQGAASGDQRPVPLDGQLSGKRRVTNRGSGMALQPGLSTQHPLPPNRCVVAKARERQAFATEPACGREPP